MAEKEEKQKRLLIKEYDLVCDLADCKHCEEKDWCSEKDGMTRQEAIKKISSHLLMRDISTMDTDEIAEAALTALLEEGKYA